MLMWQNKQLKAVQALPGLLLLLLLEFTKIFQTLKFARFVFSFLSFFLILKVTAQRLTLSKQTIPHYYLTIECNVDALLK